MRSPSPPLSSPGLWWIEGLWTIYLDVIVTSCQRQCPCLHDIALWIDTRKNAVLIQWLLPWVQTVEEEETVIHFFCQCPSLAECSNRLFGSPPFLVSLTDLACIDIKHIASFFKLIAWFYSVGQWSYYCADLALINFFLSLMVLSQYRDVHL